jgi:hypothetical protein
MFRQTWKKYLPVITILMKRAATSEQSLSMNNTDFERAAGGKKVKYTFSDLLLINGRIDHKSKRTPLALDFVLLLQEDPQTHKLLQKQQFEFSMTNQFQLLIKNSTPVSEPVVEAVPETETPDNS